MRDTFVNPLPGVPDIESPFFEVICAGKNLDEETMRIARSLHTEGFAIFQFPDPEFDSIAEAIKLELTEQFPWDHWRQRAWEAGEGLRVIDAWESSHNVKRIATNPTVIDLLSQLYGRPAWPFQTLNFPVGTQQHYHTDTTHFNTAPERYMCGVWVALEDIDEECGPLVYYPGSHRWPIYLNEHIGRTAETCATLPNQGWYEPLWRSLVNLYGIKPTVFYPKKGQAYGAQIYCMEDFATPINSGHDGLRLRITSSTTVHTIP